MGVVIVEEAPAFVVVSGQRLHVGVGFEATTCCLIECTYSCSSNRTPVSAKASIMM
ncbi:hypothetical protein SCLCIDRAFT_1220454 [Scleroderma citrinum Foug A]|uniref:Uncharacterized protein n=1 Tax=Scleroderma citrinum Foug A TaxID=1036808 RepID=A0A0C3DIY6_9AGAM|nr:hypothetical protein SCLCIDRAFT_1220454 [Scleroderma citrinum Foug A]